MASLPPDTEKFLCRLAKVRHFPSSDEERTASGLFDWDAGVTVARAPGRMDVMGGIADYSGSLVLQMPIGEACHVAAQEATDGKLRVVSFGAQENHRSALFETALASLLSSDGGSPLEYGKAKALVTPEISWALYVAGTVLVLMKEKGVRFKGLRILVDSAVPEGKGVSSSAAVEVATMQAIAKIAGASLEPLAVATLCQVAENHVVGAPCGIMDQCASVLGRQNELLALLCRPAAPLGSLRIPPNAAVWGIDSGVRHSVGGSDYGSVRVGAFMGRRILSQELPAVVKPGSWLTELSPHEFDRSAGAVLPEDVSGGDFLRKYGTHDDAVTAVDPARTYAVKKPTQHPVFENFRVRAFAQALDAPQSDAQLALLGQLMLQSHVSYSGVGLGSPNTDLLVSLVEELGPERGLFGAKITGGGSGGTVCVLGAAGAEAAVQEVLRRYTEKTGIVPFVFRGSSMGAAEFGARQELLLSSTGFPAYASHVPAAGLGCTRHD